MFNVTTLQRKRAILPVVLLTAIMIAGCVPFTPPQSTEEAAVLHTPGITEMPEVTDEASAEITPEITPEITLSPTSAQTPTSAPTSTPTPVPTPDPTPTPTPDPLSQSVFKNLKVGDVIEFGSYEQDNDAGNGKEKIEWLVLKKGDDRVLLISKYVLDRQSINDAVDYQLTWETCKLRTWLNSTFLSSAFTSEEQSSIPVSLVTADRNPDNSDPNLDPGNDTSDRLFLLSMVEVNKYFDSYEARKCAGTPYAISRGLQVAEYDVNAAGEHTSPWWTRTAAPALFQPESPFAHPGQRKGMGYVNSAGIMPSYGGDVEDLYMW